MNILFIRHGHPNYRNDCLTELGHEHAKRAAERLRDEGIDEIYSSTCGRALETAQHTADLLGLPVTPLEFMREISWGASDGTELFERGHPWYTATKMASEGKSLNLPDWQTSEDYCKNDRAIDACARVIGGIDPFLATFGYRREGLYYRIEKANEKTIAIFAHGGAGSVAFAHLLNIPMPQIWGILQPDFTSITKLRFVGEEGTLVSPFITILNDCRHIEGINADLVYS